MGRSFGEALEVRGQKCYCIFEVQVFNLHDEVDGVEILVATEAASEIGFGIRRGVKL